MLASRSSPSSLSSSSSLERARPVQRLQRLIEEHEVTVVEVVADDEHDKLTNKQNNNRKYPNMFSLVVVIDSVVWPLLSLPRSSLVLVLLKLSYKMFCLFVGCCFVFVVKNKSN